MAALATSRRILVLAAALFLAVCLQASAAEGTQYTVGGAEGWRVPPPEDKERYYANWASNFTFYVDDSIEFVYKNDSVIRVDKAGYYHCNETAAAAGAPPPPRDGTTLFVLDAPGPAYFASADPARCAMGERLMLDVQPAAAANAPSPWAPPSWGAPSPGPSPQHQHSASSPPASAARAAAVLLAPVAVALAAGRFV